MRKGIKKVCGVGINDVDYVVQKYQVTDKVSPTTGKRIQKRIWVCPYYEVWKSMLKRCYSDYVHKDFPTYRGCSVCEDWVYLSKFKVWMETQAWEGRELDKDLLTPGNKVYSPDTCVFIDAKVNTFLSENNSSRGQYPIGVCYRKRKKGMVNEYTNPYRADVSDGSGNRKYLGVFPNAEEAHQAWLECKLEMVKVLANEILNGGGDPRVAKALLDRYENYKETI